MKTAYQPAFDQGSGRASVWVLVLLVLGLAILGTVGYLFLNRLTEIEQRMVSLDQQMEEVARKAEEVAQRAEEAVQKSEAAYVEALQAQENALEAARGRAKAEADRRRAEIKAERAREVAEAAQQQARLAREEVERVRREREEELDRLQKALNQIVETRRTALGLVMSLGNDFIQFDFNKATLRPENREVLAKIAGVLLTSQLYRVQIYGHTDDIGSEEYNLNLSERRAQAVRDYLIEAGIDSGIITTKGFGKSNPLVAGVSAQARQKNRRVEIGIIDTVINYERPVSGQQD